MHGCIRVLLKELEACDPRTNLYHRETIQIMIVRWTKLAKELYDEKKGTIDYSKITDTYDSVKYDMLHNLAALSEHGINIQNVSFHSLLLVACVLTCFCRQLFTLSCANGRVTENNRAPDL